MRKSDLTSPVPAPDEKVIDQTLRPSALKDFQGQDKITENLNVFISAANKRIRGTGSCPFDWPSGTWENYACSYYCK